MDKRQPPSGEKLPTPKPIERQDSAPRRERTVERRTQLDAEQAETQDAGTVEKLRGSIRKTRTPKEPSSPKEIETFVEHNLPTYLRNDADKPTFGARAFGALIRLKNIFSGAKVEGKEQLPDGPMLVVSNHFGGETGALLGAFSDRPLRIAAGEELNWKRSGFRTWLLQKFGMLSVRETLSNLNEHEKDELLARVRGKAQKKAYGEIIERERSGKITPNNDFLKSALACLLRGDAVAVFPEGLFMYDGKRELRKGYGGLELLAERYKTITGKDLPIVPVGVTRKHVGIGAPVMLGERTGDISPTDWVMAQVAKQLPENERGIYGK